MADEILEPLDAEPSGAQVPEWAAGIEDPELLKQLESAGFKTPADAVKAWSSSRSEMDRLRSEKNAIEEESMALMQAWEEANNQTEPAQQQSFEDGLTDWAKIVN